MRCSVFVDSSIVFQTSVSGFLLSNLTSSGYLLCFMVVRVIFPLNFMMWVA